MIGPGRINEKTGASITFGLGSFILMADILVVVITNGDKGGNLFQMGFPTILGFAGFFLWLIGVILLIVHRARRTRTRRSSIKQVFLRDDSPFKCYSCGNLIETDNIDFHKRVKCKCNISYDLYQDDRD